MEGQIFFSLEQEAELQTVPCPWDGTDVSPASRLPWGIPPPPWTCAVLTPQAPTFILLGLGRPRRAGPSRWALASSWRNLKCAG